MNGENTNRFIFSNDFYDNLDNTKEESNISSNNMSSLNIPIPEMKTDTSVDNTNEVSNDIVNNNSVSINSIDNSNNDNIITPNILDNTNEINLDNNNFISNDVVDNNINHEQVEDNKINDSVNDNVNNAVNIDVIPVNQEVVDVNENILPNNQFNNDTITNIDTTNNTSNYNVETGIDVNLEREVLNSKNEKKEEEILPTYEEKTDAKPVYRAIRKAPATKPAWLENVNLHVNNNTELEKKETIIKPQVVQIKQPDIINIDEELEKDSEFNFEFNQKYESNDEEDFSNLPVTKSDLLDKLTEQEKETGNISILARYGEDFCSRDYVTNPAIGRSEEIKQLSLILLTPEKSAVLVGKPGIGKTSIVEGLAYLLQRDKVPDALKGYCIISVKTASLLGTLPTGETRLQTLVNELKTLDKVILFIDEIHMLMGATSDTSLDFANMFKESLGRGSIKMIGATTNDEYEKYVLRDKAFVRRFQRVDVLEPTRDQTIKILMGTLPKIEKNTNAKLKYSNYIQSEIMAFIVDITAEYKRVYGIGSRYPDICLTLLSQAFSQAVFDNRNEVDINDIRNAISNSKNIYPDVIRKELANFDNKFSKLIDEE